MTGTLRAAGILFHGVSGILRGLRPRRFTTSDYLKWRYDDLPILPVKWEYTIGKDKAKQFELLRELLNRADVTEVSQRLRRRAGR